MLRGCRIVVSFVADGLIPAIFRTPIFDSAISFTVFGLFHFMLGNLNRFRCQNDRVCYGLPHMQSLPRLTLPTALFLDFDGTLVDLAEQPELVHVPPELVPLLTSLYERLGGALAVVSGRRIVDLDTFLAPLELPAAG